MNRQPMLRRKIDPALAGLAALALFACSGDPVPGDGAGADADAGALGTDAPALTGSQPDDGRCSAEDAARRGGLMTGLPLIYPLDADFGAFARGEVDLTWQAQAIGHCFTAVPLDTLSLIEGLGPDAPASDPLADLDFLAVIQPRGLSPQDNVALDNWVRAGGRLLLVLDPMLTGEYDLPLGDPRRPSAIALIPPVAARWGMQIAFDERQEFAVRHADLGPMNSGVVNSGGAKIPVLLGGEVAASGDCLQTAPAPVQRCVIGKGTVTLFADAAIFEDENLAGANGAAIQELLAFAFDQ